MTTVVMSPSSSAIDIVAKLESLKSEDGLAGMRRVGIRVDQAFGIPNPALRKIARQIGRDHGRALQLWKMPIRELRLLAIYTADPEEFTSEDAKRWANDFASWEIVDTAADLFVEADLDHLIPEFAEDEREFVRRTAFAMIAGMTAHRKAAPDEALLRWLPLIERHSDDDRNFVRKAVNWALRNIGKRNLACHGPALALARTLAASADKTMRKTGKEAVRELTAGRTVERLREVAKPAGRQAFFAQPPRATRR